MKWFWSLVIIAAIELLAVIAFAWWLVDICPNCGTGHVDHHAATDTIYPKGGE